MTGLRGTLFIVLIVARGIPAGSAPPEEPRPEAPSAFRLFLSLPSPPSTTPLLGLDDAKAESLLRLPGDADSVFTLGGPCPSGQAGLRLAVEVNDAVLRVLAPDPKIESSDLRGRSGGDWKPIDSTGRPYQLRFGARIIW